MLLPVKRSSMSTATQYSSLVYDVLYGPRLNLVSFLCVVEVMVLFMLWNV